MIDIRWPGIYNVLHFSGITGNFYMGGLYSDGVLFVEKWSSGAARESSAGEVLFDPTQVDLDVELRATETQVELRVWPTGEERPEAAQVILEDTEYRGAGGLAGIAYEDDTDRLPGRVLSVEVGSPGNELFDDFADNNPFNCDPVCWMSLDCCPGDFSAPEGIDILNATLYSALLLTQDHFSGDAFVRSRFTFNGPRSEPFEDDRYSMAPQFYNVLHFSGITGNFYMGGLYSDGVLFVEKWSSGAARESSAGEVLFDPAQVDLDVELRATETQVELRVWPTGEERPEAAQVILEDTEYRGAGGLAGIAYEDDTDRLPGRVLSVEVANEVLASFRRGDSDADSNRDLSDAVFTLHYLFAEGETLSCEDAADADDNGKLEITDAVYLLSYLFRGGPAPESPFPACGPDPTEDGLGCQSYAACGSQGGRPEACGCWYPFQQMNRAESRLHLERRPALQAECPRKRESERESRLKPGNPSMRRTPD